MMRSLYTSESGMREYAGRVETVSHNIANINTPAFKRRQRLFQDLVFNRNGSSIGNGVNLSAIQTDTSSGGLQKTSGPTDIAIQGEGYFILEDAGGDSVYTRDGSFHLDADGRLVHSSGLILRDDIVMHPFSEGLTINSDGKVLVNIPGEGVAKEIGIIEIATFTNPAGLQAIGSNLFRETANSGEPEYVVPGSGKSGMLAQGMLEMSNVILVNEIVSLLTSERAFELNSKALQTSNSLIQTALNL